MANVNLHSGMVLSCDKFVCVCAAQQTTSYEYSLEKLYPHALSILQCCSDGIVTAICVKRMSFLNVSLRLHTAAGYTTCEECRDRLFLPRR